MTDDFKRLEAKIDQLTDRVRRLEDKALSGAGEVAPTSAAPSQIEAREPVATPTPRERVPATTIISFVGRSLVVLGGAFLLRWLTQSAILPQKLRSVIGVLRI